MNIVKCSHKHCWSLYAKQVTKQNSHFALIFCVKYTFLNIVWQKSDKFPTPTLMCLGGCEKNTTLRDITASTCVGLSTHIDYTLWINREREKKPLTFPVRFIVFPNVLFNWFSFSWQKASTTPQLDLPLSTIFVSACFCFVSKASPTLVFLFVRVICVVS